jgi:hypothetical protein
MLVLKEVSTWDMPVSSSVRLIRYSTMIPFLVRSGGGVQVRRTDVELMTERMRLSGGLEGAVQGKDNLCSHTTNPVTDMHRSLL